jgi:hypothetical protein
MVLVIPQPPVITNIGNNFFTINVVPTNPVGTYYAIQIIFSGSGGFLTPAGVIQPIEMWINTQQIQVANLTPGTNYSIRLSAADDAIGTNATAFGTTANITTLNGSVSNPSIPFTSYEQAVIAQSRQLMPEIFSRNTRDEKILAYANLVLAFINSFPPYTGFTINDVGTNPILAEILYFGISLTTELFLQARATLEDFQYNDAGLSLNVDQVGKISQSYANMVQFYTTMITNYKKTQIFAVGAVGLSTPRYQSTIGQFLKISLGSSFSWNT